MKKQKMLNFKKLSLVIAAGSVFTNAFAQKVVTTKDLQNGQNSISTAVPFLGISPDARAAALGDAGVAMPDDINAMHWNLAKAPFNTKNGAVAISYTPWLRNLVPDISLSYLTAYYKLDKRSAIAGSLRYFSLGQIQFTDNFGASTGNFTPNEFSLDLGYATKLNEKFSLGVAFRYIYSNLAGGFNQSQTPIDAGVSYAGDISAYYRNNTVFKDKASGKKYNVNYGFGAVISNIGSKLTYTSAQFENFIPINLRLGGYANVDIDEYNSIALMVDFNKLLVPTNPYYLRNSRNNADSLDPKTRKPIITEGMDPNVPVVQGMIQSFYDAPGGFSEEMSEINISTGLEYWYNKQFALRGGYFHEPPTKGNRQYATFGVGLRYNVFGLDVAYLWPFQQRHPLENTLRFTLTFDFDAFVEQKDAPAKKKVKVTEDEAPAE
ncbi:MAG: type IX secretion system outer membrane channel protein PorV [Bacteroidia bacterium]|nr:type IX secretion system outer membrane channel protein PorV [Bacteroidia bacterium]